MFIVAIMYVAMSFLILLTFFGDPKEVGLKLEDDHVPADSPPINTD